MIFVYVMRYLRRVPRDWETVKTVSHETVHRNRMKLVAIEKALNSIQLFHTFLGNSQNYHPRGAVDDPGTVAQGRRPRATVHRVIHSTEGVII